MHNATQLQAQLQIAQNEVVVLRAEVARHLGKISELRGELDTRARANAKQIQANANLRHELSVCRQALRSATEQLAAPKLRIRITVE